MKNLLFIVAILSGVISVKAQNPFAEYGYTPKIVTLSNGQFNEFFDNDTIVQICSVLYNTRSRKIVAFVDSDIHSSKETVQPDVVSRWMSPDPLAEQYPSWSPYKYVMNNPIKFLDPDGQRVVLAGGPVNQHVSAKTLMQIAATNNGAARLNALIGNSSTFTVDRSWGYRGNTYDPSNGNISYTSIYGTLYYLTEKEIRSTNSTVRLGHELNHAYDMKDIPFFMGNEIANNNKKSLEYNAVSFDNYLRDVYGISDKRKHYTFSDGSVIGTPTNTNPTGEKISGFELLNFDASNPYSADLLSPNHPLEATYKKTIGKSETQTYWMRMSINDKNEISYQIYNSYEEFNKK